MRDDFVKVKLTAAAERLAGDGEILVMSGTRAPFRFKAGEVQEVTRVLDWQDLLSAQRSDGVQLFQLVPEEAVSS